MAAHLVAIQGPCESLGDVGVIGIGVGVLLVLSLDFVARELGVIFV